MSATSFGDSGRSANAGFPRNPERGRDRIFTIVSRPSWRSSLFWWLLENHDALVEAEVASGLGLPWRELCAEFAALGLTSTRGGETIGRALAKKTWQRVKKEKRRLDQRLAAAEAARAAKAAADPRRKAPSRWSGPFEAPLADQPAASRAVARSAGRPVAPRRGSPDEDVDLEMFVRTDGEPEPWDDPKYTPKQKENLKKQLLLMRRENWKKDRLFDPQNPIDRELRRRKMELKHGQK